MATDKDILRELTEISPKLAGLPVTNPYMTPSGYFEGLPELVIQRIRTAGATTAEEEIRILAPTLHGLNRKPTFTLPDGYFEELAIKIPTVVNHKQQAKVVSMFSGRRIIRYAAAAVIAGIIATGAWFFTNNSSENGESRTIAKTDSSIEKQMQAQASRISDSEMLNYLDGNQAITGADSSMVTTDIKPADMKDLLANITDKELQHFLEHDDPRAEKFN